MLVSNFTRFGRLAVVGRRLLSTGAEKVSSTASSGIEGFVNVLKQFEEEKKKPNREEKKPAEKKAAEPPGVLKSFGQLLRESKLMQLGDIEGRTIIGVINETVSDDLYIDFGGKFHCVCQRPNANKSLYKKGVKVRLRLIDLEMTSYFMGAAKELTLLEADAILLGLADDPLRMLQAEIKEKQTDESSSSAL